MGKPIEQHIKKEIMNAIKYDGLSVPDAAVKYGIKENTIYYWVKKDADGSGTSALEMNKLRRENEQLKGIIGMLMLEQERSKKNHQG